MDDLINRIISTTGLTKEEVEEKITMKQHELSDLVSKEGAAYIIAKELGLNLFQKSTRRLEVKNIIPGIKNLNATARVLRVFEPREFEKNGKKSKVCNIVLGDGTGTVRMSLWDDQCDFLENIKEGIAVEVFGSYTKEDYRGEAEIRISKRGGIRILDHSDLPEISLEYNDYNNTSREDICNFKPGGSYETRAAFVQLFDSIPLFEVCPECGSRVKKEEDFTCKTHGKVEPKKSLVISGVIDDGTANMRAVLFRENALELLNSDIEEVIEKRSGIFEDKDILGKDMIFTGRVRVNPMFKRSEFIVSGVKEADIASEANKLLKALKAN